MCVKLCDEGKHTLEDSVALCSSNRIDRKDRPQEKVSWEIVKSLSDDEDEGYEGELSRTQFLFSCLVCLIFFN